MPKKSGEFYGSLSLSLMLLLVVCVAPLPGEARQVIALLLLVWWLGLGTRWTFRRHGTKGIVALSLAPLVLGAAVGYAYWQDEPNRRLAAQIERLGGHAFGKKEGLLKGRIYSVHFDANAKEEQIRQFTDLDGLDGIEDVFIRGTPLTDATAKRLGKLTGLRFLFVKDTGITEETIAELQDKLPNCRIETR